MKTVLKMREALICMSVIALFGFGFVGAVHADWDTSVTGQVTTDDNVGIGTTSPAQKLDVSGNALFSGQVSIGTTDVSGNYYKLRLYRPSGDNYLKLETGSSNEAGIEIKVNNGPPSFIWQDGSNNLGFWVNGQDRISINSSGNVGIGTTSPTQALDVNGSIKVPKTNWSGILFGDTYKGILWRNGIAINDKSVMIGNDGNSVEIVWDTFRDGVWAYCEGVTDNGSPAYRANCADYTSLMTAYDYYWIWKHGANAQHPESADLKFLFDGESNDGVMGFMEDEDYFYFDDNVIFNGNVGVGTSNPDSRLHVNGNGHVTGDLQVDGNIGAKYQDLAEWVMTTEQLTPGTVVMIDTENIDHVSPSDKAYNTLVAGVVSPAPGILLGEGGKDKAIIAHTGRVKVKVDTSYGAIKTGDLLVSSPVRGYAMKSEPVDIGGTKIHRPGTIIGKALEPLHEGKKGEILALITLQ